MKFSLRYRQTRCGNCRFRGDEYGDTPSLVHDALEQEEKRRGGGRGERGRESKGEGNFEMQ